MLRKDADGKYPLSGREYQAMLTLFGFGGTLDNDSLKERLRTIPHGWRDMRLAVTTIDRLLDKLLGTVPEKKLRAIQTELKHAVCELKIVPPVSHPPGCVYVEESALINLADRAISMDCMFCMKNDKECTQCELYRTLSACFPYELDGAKGCCPFAGRDHITLIDHEEDK